ncbi:MAG: ATP-binding protein [Flavitalea sp.]
MTGKRIIYYILSAFIVGNLLLIYIQYNSTKNIKTLIGGNEKLLAEFKVNNELKELEKDVIAIESKITGIVSTRDSLPINELELEIEKIEAGLKQLQKISDNDSSVKYIDILDRLIHEKLNFSNQVLSAFHLSGKVAADHLISARRGRIITDSIGLVTQKIDITRQKLLAAVTISIDESGKKAQQFGTALIILVLISAAVLFWYIINTISSQGQFIRLLNISEKKVREAVQIKEKFMANMSHEIRTPMNAILGFTNLLQRKNLDTESKEYVQTIQKSGENLLSIVNDILDLSKIEAGMMRIESVPFSIRGLVHSIETMFSGKINEKHLLLSSTIDESLPDNFDGDATRLTQILVNLIGNAIKFTQEGSITITITNEGRTGDTVMTGITVADTGIGIDNEKLKSIFERFQQAEDSVTRKYGGTGLGLSIVKDLALLQNGSIRVESEPGKGASFHLAIPYKISGSQLSMRKIPEDNIIVENNFEEAIILVVEDNEINQSLIRHLFREWGLEFDMVSNGREAIDRLRSKKYNLILMDIQMPEMDGYSATQEIRGILQLDTPIIAMTAHAFAGEREKSLSYGMNEYISKPIREEHLHQLIARFINIKTPVGLKKETVLNAIVGEYQYISLGYMKDISGGNTAYERTVASQFIEVIPHDLQALENAWKNADITTVRHLAHNMRTSVSVMGLTEMLQPYLDIMEYENLNEDIFLKNYSFLKLICHASVEETKIFLDNL